MKQSLLKYFAWISLVLMATVSCRSSRIHLSGEQVDMISDSILNDSFEKITFKAKVIFRERELTGFMLIKNSGVGNYKIAFFNELGMTYLEGTLENTSKRKKLVVKNIAPVINYKIFVKNFEKCLRTVFSGQTTPLFPSSPLPGHDESSLVVKLRNGFILELTPQITQINTD